MKRSFKTHAVRLACNAPCANEAQPWTIAFGHTYYCGLSRAPAQIHSNAAEEIEVTRIDLRQPLLPLSSDHEHSILGQAAQQVNSDPSGILCLILLITLHVPVLPSLSLDLSGWYDGIHIAWVAWKWPYQSPVIPAVHRSISLSAPAMSQSTCT